MRGAANPAVTLRYSKSDVENLRFPFLQKHQFDGDFHARLLGDNYIMAIISRAE